MKFEQEAKLTLTIGLLIIPVILCVMLFRVMETQDKVDMLSKQVRELKARR